MKVHSAYRTVILQMKPDLAAQKELRKVMEWVQSFLDMSRIDIQGMLYRKWKDMGIPMSTRIVALLTQRFAGAVTGKDKRFLYLYGENSRFVYDREWFLEAQLHSKDGKHVPPRIRIPVYKTEVPYYADIQDMAGYPVMVTEEGEKWFAYVQIPVEFDDRGIEGKVIGIDFNFNKWVAAPASGKPLMFDASGYGAEIDRISAQISQKQSYIRRTNAPDRLAVLEREINDLYALRTAVVKRAHGNFIAAIKDKFGNCTLAVEEVATMFRLGNKDSGLTNNWLYKKTALSQFQLRAMSHGFNVMEVNPSYTSQACHRCRHAGITYGKGKRLFHCPHCGLTDYHRDVNAARNIAWLGAGGQFDYAALAEEKKHLPRIKPPLLPNL
jgi:hypothetical protein